MTSVVKRVALAPVFLLLALVVLTFPAGTAIKAFDWASGTGSLFLETVVVTVLLAATFAALWWSVGHGGIKSLLRWGRFEPAMRASSLALLAPVSFTTLTAMLHEHGVIGITPAPAPGEAVDQAFEFYLWQLADTVPLVDITGNLGWAKPLEFADPLGGLLVIVFTGLVIVPLLQVARLIIAGADAPYDVAVVRELKQLVGDDRIFIWREAEAYGRAIIDNRVLVDVVTGVWNHDALTLRLGRLEDERDERAIDGYLLVVDAITESARERLKPALAQAPFPARLVVWRSDQRRADLTEAFDALHERVTAPAPSPALRALPLR